MLWGGLRLILLLGLHESPWVAEQFFAFGLGRFEVTLPIVAVVDLQVVLDADEDDVALQSGELDEPIGQSHAALRVELEPGGVAEELLLEEQHLFGGTLRVIQFLGALLEAALGVEA